MLKLVTNLQAKEELEEELCAIWEELVHEQSQVGRLKGFFQQVALAAAWFKQHMATAFICWFAAMLAAHMLHQYEHAHMMSTVSATHVQGSPAAASESSFSPGSQSPESNLEVPLTPAQAQSPREFGSPDEASPSSSSGPAVTEDPASEKV